MHDLVRLYALELVRVDEDRHVARRRLLDYYLGSSDAALGVLAPDVFRLERETVAVPFADRAAALSWLDGERESMVALVVQCAEEGPREFAWHLADSLRGYFWLRRNAVDCWVAGQAALTAAEAAGDLDGQGAAHSALAIACVEHDRAQTQHWLAARKSFRVAGNVRGECNSLHNLGNTHVQFGRPAEAVELYGQALELIDDVPRRAMTLTGLGVAATFTGELTVAVGHLDQALDLVRSIGDEVRIAPIFAHLVDATCQLGQVDRAVLLAERVRKVMPEAASHTWRLCGLRTLAMLARDTGQAGVAEERAVELLGAAQETATAHYVLGALNVLGQLHHRAGRVDDAVAALEQGLQLAWSTDKAYQEAGLLIDLARVLAEYEPDAAARHATTALELAQERKLRVLHGRALATLASVHSEPELAARALEVQVATGHQLGQAEALVLLGRVDEARRIFRRFTGDPSAVPAGTLG